MLPENDNDSLTSHHHGVNIIEINMTPSHAIKKVESILLVGSFFFPIAQSYSGPLGYYDRYSNIVKDLALAR